MKFKNIFKFSNRFTLSSWSTSTPMNTGVGSQGNRGFTIIELLVVFFVSALIATVVMANFGDFTSNTEFENVALNIALTVREAQAYGIGSREVGNNFDIPYGVYFDTNKPNKFTLFADKNGNNVYNAIVSEKIKTITLDNGFKIKDVCVGTLCERSSIFMSGATFMFKRPNPDALIYYILTFTGNAVGTFPNGKIIIERISDGSIKTINVTDTGQIYVN